MRLVKIPTRIRTALLALLAVVALAPVSAHAAPAQSSLLMQTNNVVRYTNYGTYLWSYSYRAYAYRVAWVAQGETVYLSCWVYGDSIYGDNIWYRASNAVASGYIQDYRVNTYGVPDREVSRCIYP